MANTTNLGLPLIAASQAMKHVTHNEALEILDGVLGGMENEFGAGTLIKAISEEVTLSGATKTTTIAFPNQCIILGASVRVTQAITGATSFDAGDGSSASRFGGSLGVSLGSVNQGTIGPAGNYGSNPVILKANGSDFTGGKVRVTLHYIYLQPATS